MNIVLCALADWIGQQCEIGDADSADGPGKLLVSRYAKQESSA
jgi:hypothetical protein